jgi:very-short-patch-repair endonuclease
MRHEPTPAEKLLWSRLRDRQLNGLKFRRQQPIGPFVADFFCAECALVVELDGDSHAERVEYDAKRTAFIEREGLQVIRFVNDDVLGNTDAVLEAILRICLARASGVRAG